MVELASDRLACRRNAARREDSNLCQPSRRLYRINRRRSVAWNIDRVESVKWRIKGGRGVERKRKGE